MTDDERIATIRHALRAIEQGLAADGLGVELAIMDDRLTVQIVAEDLQACGDCLVPESVMKPMIQQLLVDVSEETGVKDLELVYPTE